MREHVFERAFDGLFDIGRVPVNALEKRFVGLRTSL